jgi:predicted amidophosphoribosyltransferase
MRLKAPQRERNVAKAFGVTDPSAVRERRVLLLDDVYTTGSTMRECARTLTRAGAADVLVVTLARVR